MKARARKPVDRQRRVCLALMVVVIVLLTLDAAVLREPELLIVAALAAGALWALRTI